MKKNKTGNILQIDFLKNFCYNIYKIWKREQKLLEVFTRNGACTKSGFEF